MGEVIGNIIAIVLVIVALSIALKVIFFVLALFGLFLGVFGLLVKLAVFGGLIYLGWAIFCKVFKRKEAF
ncbi:MAG: hypothetical protein HYR56_07340 [Acidobacteria bacterium]|nr:hypothetical protein [Acidobacteriota bacterium]MBI3425145.1 hypothetical protein [Acidobacteriota bacterium]